MHAYRELPLWKQAFYLTDEIYRATRDLPVDGDFDLAARLRAAIAIPVQIATHYSCDAVVFLRGLKRAHRALLKLEHLVQLVKRLHYWPTSQATRISQELAEIRRHMQAFFHSLAPAPQAVERDARRRESP